MTRDILRWKDLPEGRWYRVQLEWEVGSKYGMEKILTLQSRSGDIVRIRRCLPTKVNDPLVGKYLRNLGKRGMEVKG